jgi:methionyl aminopeptidase
MYFVGQGVTPMARRLTEVARECLFRGIGAVRDGARVGDVGAVIQAHAEGAGFSVVREFVGHGIGRTFHEDPQVPHYGVAGKGARLVAGMVFTIEPMINVGTAETRLDRDGWTVRTADGKRSAQFEHTVAITPDGPIRLTA